MLVQVKLTAKMLWFFLSDTVYLTFVEMLAVQLSDVRVVADVVVLLQLMLVKACLNNVILEMWANAQRDGRLPNIGGALCSTPQSLADAHY